MAGTWSGIVHRYPNLIYVTMTLTPSGPGLEGSLKFQPIADYWGRVSIEKGLQSGTATVSVAVDGGTDSFRLSVRRGSTGDRFDVASALSGVRGVLDLRHGLLAGKDATQQDFFIFARPDKFDAIDKSFRTFRNEQPRAMSGFSLGGKPGKAEMLRWMEPFYREYPNVDPYRTAHGPLEMKAINLFEDRHFSAFFGKPFDALSGGQLGSIYQGYRGGAADKPGQGLQALASMFSPIIGTHHAKQTTLWVIANRAFRSWRRAQLDKLAQMGPTDDAFSLIQGISDQMTALLKDTLWPSEHRQTEEAVATARRTLAVPALERRLKELEGGALDLPALIALSRWSQDQSVVLGYADGATRSALQGRVDARITQVVDALMPAERQRVAALGEGLPAVVNGSQWYTQFVANYRIALDRVSAQEVVAFFQLRRKSDLASAADAMLRAVREPFDRIDPAISAAGDQARIEYCNQLTSRLGEWFGTPGDNASETARRIDALAQELGGAARSLLPPQKRAQVRFAGKAAPSRASGTPRERSVAGWETTIHAVKAADDAANMIFLPPPVRDPGFEFTTDICWSIFHGRFDEIRATAGQASGIGSRVSAALRNTNPYFHYAFIAYVGLASQKYGENQFGPTTKLFWVTYVEDRQSGKRTPKNDGEKYPVHISRDLSDHYENSYKLAEAAANSDGMFGNNPFGFLQTYAKIVQNGLLSQAGTRADGRIAVTQAEWERPILADITTLLNAWPDRAVAVWQFHENIRRFLNGLQSLQSLFAQAVQENGWTDLHIAALRDHAVGISGNSGPGKSVDQKDRSGRTPLHLAALGGCAEATAALIRAGAEVNPRSARAATPLHYAARNESTRTLALLVAAKAQLDLPDHLGQTPLHDAAELGNIAAIQALLKAGAKPDIVDKSGQTPLALAMAKDRVEVTRLFLDGGGGDVRSRTSGGGTLLHQAAQQDSKQLIGELIAKGADVNATNPQGQTPLHVAAMHNAASAIDALVIRGANLQAKDANGRTPLEQAIASNHETAILALRRHLFGGPGR